MKVIHIKQQGQEQSNIATLSLNLEIQSKIQYREQVKNRHGVKMIKMCSM